MNSKKLRAVAALGTLSAGVWAATFATFTDEATSTATFSSGTIDIELADELDDGYAFTALSMTNMKPGDASYETLKIENAGSLAMSYAMTSAESEAVLSNALELAAIKGASSCDASAFSGVGAVVGTIGGVETVIANGPLANAAIASRTLAAGTAETLCVRVQLPSSTGNTAQGLETTSTFTFNATQTGAAVVQ